jgi:hypothetical protein
MTGWRIDIRSDVQAPEAIAPVPGAAAPVPAAPAAEPPPATDVAEEVVPANADVPAALPTAEVTP